MKKRTTFTIEENLLKRLDKIARRSRVPKSRIAESGLEKAIEELEHRYDNNNKESL